MAQLCSVCKRADRKEIDRAIAEAETDRTISGRFNLSKSSVQRHRSNCLASALEKIDTSRAASALEHCLWIVGKLRSLAETCESHPRQFLATADSLVRSLAVLGRLTGEISNTTNVLFANLGVRNEDDLKSRLALASAIESQGTPEESYQDFVQMGRLLLADHPELRHSLAVELGLDSYAEVVGGDEREISTEPGTDATTPRPHTNGAHE